MTFCLVLYLANATFLGRKIIQKYAIVGTRFEHYSYEMSEFKPNEPSTMNL